MEKRQESKHLNTLLFVVVLSLVAYSFVALLHDPVKPTGKAATQTATVALTINVTEQNITNVTGLIGGRAGGGRVGNVMFTVAPIILKLNLIKGEGYIGALRVKNTGDLTFAFEGKTNREFISLGKNAFTLAPGEEAMIPVTIAPLKPGTEAGKIIISTSFSEVQVPVIIAIQSKEASFGMDFTMPQQLRIVAQQGEIYSKLRLTGLEGGFVDIRYALIDAANKIIYEEREVEHVLNEFIVEKTMRLPSFVTPGTYAYTAIVHYKGTTKASAELVTIRQSGRAVPPPTMEEPSPIGLDNPFIIFFVVLCVVTLHVLMARKKKEEPIL